MSISEQLQEIVSAEAERAGVPGVSVGMVLDGEEHYAVHGVTSIENPLPVEQNTLFQFGSTAKTFTGTAITLLAQRGEVDLDAPVRRYLPDFAVADETAAATVTVLNLLNHTAGWAGDRMGDSRDRGERALARFVASLADAEQEFAVGETMSYNNAALGVAGRVIEVVTGQVFEEAMTDLVLRPLGMENSFFFAEDVMTRRFVVGHVPTPDGMAIARPWNIPRSNAAAGGITASAHDLVRWIRFHLGDGTTSGGDQLMETAWLHRMQQPTVTVAGSALGDHVGISWLLDDAAGVRSVSHGGSTIGQESAFTMIPEKGFGITSNTNASGPGSVFNTAVVNAVKKEFLGLEKVTPVAVDRPAADLSDYTGSYETVALTIEVSVDGGGLSAAMEPQQSFLDSLGARREDFLQPPTPLGMLEGDAFVATGGSSQGMTGAFVRDRSDRVSGVHLGGRLARRAR